VQVYLTARHLELTNEIRAHVEKRIVQAIRDHGLGDKVMRLEIQLIHEARRDAQLACHVLAQLKGHQDVNVRELASDAMTAIDLMHDRLLPLLTEQRDRLLTLRRHPRKYSVRRLLRALGWDRASRRLVDEG
jgi:ribosome-associated translation inhibitor RaiA